MREFYERIERKHGYNKAIVAVSRKMLSILHVMLTRKNHTKARTSNSQRKNINGPRE